MGGGWSLSELLISGRERQQRSGAWPTGSTSKGAVILLGVGGEKKNKSDGLKSEAMLLQRS